MGLGRRLTCASSRWLPLPCRLTSRLRSRLTPPAPHPAPHPAPQAKLAAAGISVLISSGDSGSGYSAGQCGESSYKRDTEITEGDVIRSENVHLTTCCEVAGRTVKPPEKAPVGFTWVPPLPRAAAADLAATDLAAAAAARRASPPSSAPYSIKFADTMYHVYDSYGLAPFPKRDLQRLTGEVGPQGGVVKVHNANGTFEDTTIAFSAPFTLKHSQPGQHLHNLTMNVNAQGQPTTAISGVATCTSMGAGLVECFIFSIHAGGSPNQIAFLLKGPNAPPPPVYGNCTLFSKVTATGPSTRKAVSGGSSLVPTPLPVLYPSWPASSPWVTAVGATRFVNQTVGAEEMASDQFGSGGGFSTLFNQSHAPWQAAAVAAYVAQGPSLPKFPPDGSFPPLGRATPDVSALGEGYQVYVRNNVQSVGGTSASSPAFAGFVSLLNEARRKAGKPQMGYLNPFLYANANCFTDVTKGTNAIGRGTGPVAYGFAAAPGWDPATGLVRCLVSIPRPLGAYRLDPPASQTAHIQTAHPGCTSRGMGIETCHRRARRDSTSSSRRPSLCESRRGA